MGLQFGGHAPQVAAAPPVNGGNCAMQGFDTPTTRRKRASRMAQNPHRHHPEVRHVASKIGAGPLGAKKLAQHDPSGDSSAKKLAQHA